MTRTHQTNLQSKQRVGKRRATNAQISAQLERVRAAASILTRKHNLDRKIRCMERESRRDCIEITAWRRNEAKKFRERKEELL